MAGPPNCPVDCFPVDVEVFSKDRCHFGWICIVEDHVREFVPVAGGDRELPLDVTFAGGPDGFVIVDAGVDLVELQSPVVVLCIDGGEFGPLGVGAELAPELEPAVFHPVDAFVGNPFGEHDRVSSGHGLCCSASRPLKAAATSPVKEACCASRLLCRGLAGCVAEVNPLAAVRVALACELGDADLVPDCLLGGSVVVVGDPVEVSAGGFALDCIKVGCQDR